MNGEVKGGQATALVHGGRWFAGVGVRGFVGPLACSPTGEEVLSCTIIVSDASEWMMRYHDRMPVLLQAEDFDAWLNGTLGPEALNPAAGNVLREWTVTKRINNTGIGDDDPTVIEKVAA